MKETTDDMPAYEAQKNYTLKVLFGPLFGCELHLPADDYFLIINSAQALQDTTAACTPVGVHAAYYAQNTLYLPCDAPSPNIILRLSSPAEDESEMVGDFRVEVQDQEGSYPIVLKQNEIFTHQHIRFAVKRSDEQWPENIKNFNLPPVPDAEFSVRETPEVFNTRKYRTLISASALLVIFLLTAAVVWYQKMEDDKHVLTLNQLLAGAPAALDIVRGRDDKTIYVLAADYQEMAWAQEALFKLGENDGVVPVWLTQQKKEVITQLANAGYPVLQLDYSTPQHPVMAIYQPLSTQQEESLKSAVLQKIPFALDVKTMVKTKNQLLQEARQGLDRLHIYYRQINTPTGYALVIRDALSDHVLTALQRFITDFNHQWGNRIINFSVNLEENWLQNKSYLDSSDGYLFLNPRHWYFPLRK